MRPAENIEKLIKNTDIDTNAKIDEEVLGEVVEAFEKSKGKKTSAVEQNIGRIIMKSKITKLGTAAVIIAAIGLVMYTLIGSGTSITMAQVRQAMENIDWMQMILNRAEESDSVWYSFASKVEILVNSNGRIVYSDFKTRKKHVWNPGSKDIYESSIDEGHDRGEFLGGTSGPFELFNKMFGFLNEQGYKVTKELGTYQGQKVEVWSASRVKEKADSTQIETFTVYIDVDRKLPIAAIEDKGPDSDVRLRKDIEFKYPETGPADIYEAGAPRSAQIKPSPEQ